MRQYYSVCHVQCYVNCPPPFPAVSWIPVVAEVAVLSSVFISLLLSSSVTLVVVAVAWVRYRPIYAMAVLLGALVPFLIPKLFSPKQRND